MRNLQRHSTRWRQKQELCPRPPVSLLETKEKKNARKIQSSAESSWCRPFGKAWSNTKEQAQRGIQGNGGLHEREATRGVRVDETARKARPRFALIPGSRAALLSPIEINHRARLFARRSGKSFVCLHGKEVGQGYAHITHQRDHRGRLRRPTTHAQVFSRFATSATSLFFSRALLTIVPNCRRNFLPTSTKRWQCGTLRFCVLPAAVLLQFQRLGRY